MRPVVDWRTCMLRAPAHRCKEECVHVKAETRTSHTTQLLASDVPLACHGYACGLLTGVYHNLIRMWAEL